MTHGRAARGRRARPLAGVAMAAPAVVLFTSMMVVPLLLLLYLSLTDWNGYSPDPGWVGLGNYRRAFADPEVGHAALVTAVIAVVGTLGQNILGLGFAVLLNGSARVKAFFRAVLFYPHVIAALVIGYLWAAILGPQGAVNTLLSLAGGGEAPFLSDPDWALASVVAVIMWAGFGVNVVLYLAGLQTVPASLIESARMDGAGRWQTFRRVTVPLIAPVITLNIVLVLIQLLRTYDLVRSLTAGGPAGRTQTMAYLVLSSSFDRAALGLGCAQAVLLLIASATFAFFVIGLRRRAEQAALL
jgi:raffinose/stachyose/melibiose transport system permease protein